MHMQVKHHLPAGSLAELLDNDPFRTKRPDRRGRDHFRGPRDLREIIRLDIEDAACRSFWYHQRMTRRARHDVQESQRVLVFIDLVARDLAAQDFGENILVVVFRHGFTTNVLRRAFSFSAMLPKIPLGRKMMNTTSSTP